MKLSKIHSIMDENHSQIPLKGTLYALIIDNWIDSRDIELGTLWMKL